MQKWQRKFPQTLTQSFTVSITRTFEMRKSALTSVKWRFSGIPLPFAKLNQTSFYEADFLIINESLFRLTDWAFYDSCNLHAPYVSEPAYPDHPELPRYWTYSMSHCKVYNILSSLIKKPAHGGFLVGPAGKCPDRHWERPPAPIVIGGVRCLWLILC